MSKRIVMARACQIDTNDTVYTIMLPALFVSTCRPGHRKRAHPGVRRELVELLLKEVARRLR